MAVEERHPDAKSPEALLAELDVARPLDKGEFMCQAYGRDAWNPPVPVRSNEPIDGVYKFSVPLMESLGDPMNWGSLFKAIQQV
eukprot:9008154-Alexandrium_andersonii.AAC.1